MASEKEAEKKCWICGSIADSGEHLIKASDLRALFGKPTQAKPLYLHTRLKRNQPVGSIKSSKLKFLKGLCSKCNNQRTQPHDLAWEKASAYLRNKSPKISPGMQIRSNRIFKYGAKKSMINVHLFFVKLFGCLIDENGIPIDISLFSQSILQGKAHPKVHITIGTGLDSAKHILSHRSVVQTAFLGGKLVFASWFYTIGDVWVNIIYAEPFERRQALIDSWNPRSSSKRIRIVQF